VDGQEPSEALPRLLAHVRDAGVARVSIHARKAWLQGLSPRENREVPPLDYALVHAMKERFPDLHLSINGGIADIEDVLTHLEIMDGVMVGRAAYHDPAAMLLRADGRVFGAPDPQPDRISAALAMGPYLEEHCARGGRPGQVTRHMLGLFAGQPGARAWRRALSEGAARPDAGLRPQLGAADRPADRLLGRAVVDRGGRTSASGGRCVTAQAGGGDRRRSGFLHPAGRARQAATYWGASVTDDPTSDRIWVRAEIESPCVQVCVIHPETRLCTGCARTIDEIGAWSRMTPEERSAVMAELPARQSAPRNRRGGRAARLKR
jgi:predicted Fe-S protein YdhL (DUF1289 family)